jgi:hypothetical protein
VSIVTPKTNFYALISDLVLYLDATIQLRPRGGLDEVRDLRRRCVKALDELEDLE